MSWSYGQDAVTRLMDVAIATLGSADLSADPRDTVAGPLLRALGADLVCFNEVGRTVETTDIWALAPSIPADLVPQGEAAFDLLSGHPLVRLYAGGTTGVLATSDLPPAVWASCDAALVVTSVVGMRHQLTIRVPTAGHDGVRAWVAMRTSAGFDERDKDVARLLSPVLAAVEQHARNLRRLVDGGPVTATAAATWGLTARESVVLGLLAEGLSGSAIARRLHISPRTVEKHAEHIYRKLHVRDRVGAVLEARRLCAARRGA